MQENLTKIVAILDRSGSMQKVQADTIGGFNNFIEEQKKVPGEATITLIQFNGNYETTYADVPLNHVAPLSIETYKPSGWTALNDALAATINDVGTKLAATKEENRPSKVIFLIMTDGEENYSKLFIGNAGLKKLNEMVKHQQEKYSWAFSFIGANIDSFATAQSYGIDSKYAINYIHSGIGTANAFKTLSRGTAALRMSSNANFFENEQNISFVSDSTRDLTDIASTIEKYTKTTSG